MFGAEPVRSTVGSPRRVNPEQRLRERRRIPRRRPFATGQPVLDAAGVASRLHRTPIGLEPVCTQPPQASYVKSGERRRMLRAGAAAGSSPLGLEPLGCASAVRPVSILIVRLRSSSSTLRIVSTTSGAAAGRAHHHVHEVAG